MSRFSALALAALALLLSPGCAASAAMPASHTVAHCSWSYFGDPRAVVHSGSVYTGCIGTDGRTIVEEYDFATGRRDVSTLFEPLEADDHNNPSLVVFHDRVYAFSAPHSGYLYPRNRRSRMRYRVLRAGTWGPVRTVPLGTGCGLGYTYPNPVVAGDRLYLFMRGPCWEPYFTSTRDGLHWAAPRTLVRSPSPSIQDGGGTRRVRPYVKYAATADGSIAMAFSDGHPGSFKSSLYYLRLKDGRFHRADGSVAGTLADLPLRFDQLDRVHRYSATRGRAWPMDVAHDLSGAPIVVYSSLVGTADTFRYARWDGAKWRGRPIAAAGRTLFTYHNSGVTLDHADPSRVVLSRTIGGQNEIELRQTTDHGRTWQARQLTSGSRSFNIRPVIPRGLGAEDPLVVLWVTGSARTFREYDTDVVMSIVERSPARVAVRSAIQRLWARWTTGLSWQGVASRRRSGAEAWASSTEPRDLDLDRDVAVKLIAPDRVEDQRIRARFVSEARAAAAVEHPNVLPVYAAGVAGDRAYLVMRYVHGDDLRTLVRRAGPLPVERAAEVAVAIGDALDAIHRAGFVHRDVKPANVLIDESGHVYLSDFGLAKHVFVSAGLTESDRWVGTLDFAAPEQIRGGKVDARADVYALGGVLHFMLTGAVPFERESEEAKLWAHLAAEPPRPSELRPELPAALDDVVLRALAKDPDERFRSAGDLGRAARAAPGGADAGPERTVARGAAASGAGQQAPALLEGVETIVSPRAPPPTRHRRRGLVAGAVLAALALAATIAVIATREDGGAESEPRTPSSSSAPAAEVGKTISPVGFRPRGIAVLSGDVWVISAMRERVARISADTMRPHGTQPRIGRGAVSIAAYGGSVWVAITRQGRVVELDSGTGTVRGRLPIPVAPVLVAAGPGGLWVVGHERGAGPDVLFHFDRAGRLRGQAEVRDDVTALAVGGGRAWLAHTGVPRILGYDTELRLRHRTWPEGDVAWLTYGGGRLWASVPDDDSVIRYDPRTDGMVRDDAVRNPAGLAVAGGRLLVANTTGHTVVVIDPDSLERIGDPLAVPLNPWAVVAGSGHVWVSGMGESTLTRIDY